MEFVLCQEGDYLWLPVPPESFSIQSGNQNQTVSVVRRGEINLWGPEQLEAVSIESFFPNQVYEFCHYGSFPAPWDCVNTIDEWRNSGKPLRLIITDYWQGVDINMDVLIESFEKGIRDGTGDVYFSLTLKRYKQINVIKAESPYQAVTKRDNPAVTKVISSSTNDTVANEDQGSSYTVKDGDTLWDIAKDSYGVGSDWRKIYEANKDILPDTDALEVGQVITIPE